MLLVLRRLLLLVQLQRRLVLRRLLLQLVLRLLLLQLVLRVHLLLRLGAAGAACAVSTEVVKVELCPCAAAPGR